MGKIQPGWLLGARINRQKRRLAIRTMRRSLVAECLQAGITSIQDIRAIVKERYPNFPSSTSSIRRDTSYLRQKWQEDERCDQCGHQLAPLSAKDGDGEAGFVVSQIADERRD